MEYFQRQVGWLKEYGRPVICTEYMARSVGSPFDALLPIGKAHKIGMINWGFVAGKTQTYLPWDSWQRLTCWSSHPSGITTCCDLTARPIGRRK
jgi:hypothetical protein